MTVIPAGTEVAYTVTYLEMTERPEGPPPKLPDDIRLEVAKAPPNWFFLSLYDAVGKDYEWVGWHEREQTELSATLQDPKVQLTVAYRYGWPQGFFQLDWREAGCCELAYFGLVPEAVGAGIGSAFLRVALHQGWAHEGVTRMTVNTCTLDHPRALAHYQNHGFRPVRTEEDSRVLTRDRDPSKFPT